MEAKRVLGVPGRSNLSLYTIAIWTTTGGGDVVTESRPGGKMEFLMPGQTTLQSDEEKDLDFDLTTELRDKLKLHSEKATNVLRPRCSPILNRLIL